MKTLSVVALAALAAVVALVACKSDPPKNPQPMYPPMDDAGGGAYQPYPNVPPDAGGGTVLVTDDAAAPEPVPNPMAAVFDAAAIQLLTASIKQLQPKHAPGMKVEGQLLGGMLNEGQSIEQQAMFNAGKCYTIIGTSPAGITELDIQVTLATIVPTINSVVGMDNTAGPQAFVGDHPNCIKNPLPIGGMVKIILKATKGSGLAGAQLFVK
jgi:hypothetical protein